MTQSDDVRILLFGRLGESIGREDRLDPSDRSRTIAEVKRLLAIRHPQAAAELTGPRIRACIDDRMVDDSAVIGSASEIALFPPLSGG